ncbi:MAG: YetF domain-containing protein [Thermoguttaceae bacterium]
MANISLWLEWFFGGDAPMRPLLPGQVAARAFVVYLIGLAIIRLGKSRLLGSASPIDIVLAVVLGSLLSRGINGTASISGTVVACTVLVALHWLMTRIACRSHRFGNLVKGHCRLLVEDGQVNAEVLRRSNLSYEDLLEELRLNANVDDLSRIERAYKERSGQISGVRRKISVKVVDVPIETGVKTIRVELWAD